MTKRTYKKRASPMEAAVVAWITEFPDASIQMVAKEVGCHPTYASYVRRRMPKTLPCPKSHVPNAETEAAMQEVREGRSLVPVPQEEPKSARDIQMGGDHYKTKTVQPWDVFDDWPAQQRVGAYRANCVKYALRMDDKDTPLLNAQKLAHYAQKLVEVLHELEES